MIWVVAVAGILAAGAPGAYANEQEVVDRWTVELREAQKHCDAGRYRVAKRELLAGIDAQINTVDRYLGYINESSGEERARDQRLAVQLIADRQRLTSKRAMYAHEQFVPCEEDVNAAVDYTRICDAFGAGFFYIPGTDTCLRLSDTVERRTARIEDPVLYEFSWGGSPQDSGANGMLAFSDVRISVNPSFTMSQPFQRGFLETDFGSGIETPALNLDVAPSGFQLGINVDAKLHYDKFSPFGVHFGLEAGYLQGSSSATNVSYPNGLGAPNTGNGVDIGGFSGANTTLDTADFDIERTFASLDKGLNFPLASGRFELNDGLPAIDWNAAAIVGFRGGALNQRETFNATASGGGNSTIQYQTDIMGGFVGGYVGLGLDKQMDLPRSDLKLYENFQIAAGFSNYTLHINDSLSGTGPAAPSTPSSNSYTVNATIPTLKLGAGIGLSAADNFRAGVNGGIITGYNPPIDIRRPVSNVLNPTDVVLLSTLAWYLSFSVFYSPPPN
ncbi:MAG: porin [Devosia sp.]